VAGLGRCLQNLQFLVLAGVGLLTWGVAESLRLDPSNNRFLVYSSLLPFQKQPVLAYRSFLDSTNAPMGVQKELMRHASISTTMNVYGRAMSDGKRLANSNVVGMVLGSNGGLLHSPVGS
jgi:hypothetical protein